MKFARWIVGGLLVGAPLAACSERAWVQVQCMTTTAPAFECEVVQIVGKTEVEACWDFAATCANGAEVKAERTCQKIKDGASVKVVFPAEKLSGLDKCAGATPPVAKMSGLTIDGQPTL